MTRSAGAWLLLRCTLTAVVLTGVLSYLLQSQYQIPANESIALVAFAIGALGNGWRPVISAFSGVLQTLAAGLGGRRP